MSCLALRPVPDRQGTWRAVDEGGEFGRGVFGGLLHRGEFGFDRRDGFSKRRSLSTMRGAMVRWDTSRVAWDMSRARPMAMPPETPRPWRMKLIVGCRRRARTLAFAEVVGDEGQGGVHGVLFVGAVGFDHHLDPCRPPASSPHDALGVDPAHPLAIQTSHFELAGQLGEFGGCAGVQPQLVDDFGFGGQHQTSFKRLSTPSPGRPPPNRSGFQMPFSR